ncbi:MAG: sugar ABC transporter permease, partial [Rhodobacteraceae bacterium]|nr:sugar ABC transporter permease [Paracoccaceae bacterium]
MMERTASERPVGLGEHLRQITGTVQMDTRLLAMIGAVAAIWAFLEIASGGIFLSPR